MARCRAGSSILSVAAALVLLAAVVPVQGATTGQGSGAFKVKPFAELGTLDASVASLAAMPSSLDPGPRVWDDVDRLRFNGGYTNSRHIVFLEVGSATDASAASTATVQGVTHQIADWVHVRTDQTTRYATVRATGTSDVNAAAYTPPDGFMQDGQGEVTIRAYDRSVPEDGGAATTISWIYDSSQGSYWFDAADKDFTNDNGEVAIHPASTKAKDTYVFTAAGVPYAVMAVAGAGAGFAPTIAQAWDKVPGKPGGEDFDGYVLLDFPSGTPYDQFHVTLRATIQTTK